jgi:hypothetical protein
MSSIAQVRRVLKGQVQAGAATFTDYWTGSEIERACRDCGHVWRDRFSRAASYALGLSLAGSARRQFLPRGCGPGPGRTGGGRSGA